MLTLTKEEFASEYLIYKNLSGDKPHKTYLAMVNGESGPLPVILKETDEKRAALYQELTRMWNPYLADTYEVLCVTENAGGQADSCKTRAAGGQADTCETHTADGHANTCETHTADGHADSCKTRAAGEKNDGQPSYYAVTEYVCAAGSQAGECLSLTQFVRQNGPLREKAALRIGLQLCLGLKEFHKKGFVHRDLKPDNIMIAKCDAEEPEIKIVDFGGAKWNLPSGRGDTTVVGTLGYQAPESLAVRTTRQADVYSIGCILNFLLTGQEPGLAWYRGNHYIACLIEKAANEDPSHRHDSVAELQKELEHLLGRRLIDRIPFIRALPVFRTDTMWKTILAGVMYTLLLPIGVYCHRYYTPVVSLTEVFIPYILIPLIIIFNMGNLLRFFPESLRRNNRLFFKIKVVILLIAFWEPIWINYLVTHT